MTKKSKLKPKDTVKTRNLKKWLLDKYSNNGNPMFSLLWQLDFISDDQLEYILEGEGQPKQEGIHSYPLIQREVKIHHGYKDWLEMCQDKNFISQFGHLPTKNVGKYHYIFKNVDTDNEISLIEVNNCLTEKFDWEIYCLKGGLFEDIQRFRTYEEAEEKIIEYLK